MGSNTNFHFHQVIEANQDASSELAAGVSGSGLDGLISASGTVSAVNSMTKNKKQHHILIIHSLEDETKIIDRKNLALKKDIKTILSSSYQKFTDEFGTHFIGKIFTGAVFFCRITGETTKSEKMHSISASIKAKMDAAEGEGDASMSSTIAKSASEMKLQFVVKTFGVAGSGGATAAVSIDDVIDQYKEFCLYTSEKALITGSYKAELIPYSTLPEAYCNHALESDKHLL